MGIKIMLMLSTTSFFIQHQRPSQLELAKLSVQPCSLLESLMIYLRCFGSYP